MCRHYPNSICGKDAQFYNDKLNTGTRFRLFLCQSTQADIAFIIHNKRGKVGIKAVAKACGLHFDRPVSAQTSFHQKPKKGGLLPAILLSS
ncbi:hypothetical protein FNYG_02499 [Fusarium nygamai]|uniref:Uncharacterized protein n=1 Tax=Gibberella nygamai TaxID=42673 RepID=A0A2K0WNG7_GIBNY|nr:hypothetical protein FNYG_02499 [Fusarium nygamai]